jgi:hypothetical protein
MEAYSAGSLGRVVGGDQVCIWIGDLWIEVWDASFFSSAFNTPYNLEKEGKMMFLFFCLFAFLPFALLNLV